MRRATLGLALATLFPLAAVAPTAAAAQRGEPRVLTLERALEIARRNNPAYRRAANRLELNGPETRAAWTSGILPALNVNLLTTGYRGNLQRRATDNFGNPIANPEADYVYFSSTTQGIGLTWQLSGASPWYRLRRIGAENRERELDEELAGEALRLTVTRAFFEALEREELLDAERRIADASRMDREAAERLFALALKTRVDVLQVELQVEQQQLAIRRQQAARDQARLALGSRLGQSTLPEVHPVPTELPLFDSAELDERALLAVAVDGSAAVRQADAALRSADIGQAESRSLYWPQLTASFNLGRFVQSPSTGSLFDLGGFRDEGFSNFYVGVSLPFLNSALANRRDISRTQIARENGEEELREARLDAERQARSALVELRNRWNEAVIAERSFAIAVEVLELAREEYRLGTRTFEQLQESLRSEADAQRQLIQVRYGFVDALLDLEQAVGAPVR